VRWLVLAALLCAVLVPAALADAPASRDSVQLVGEFVDPVCFFQHGMLGPAARRCALVSGRVEQGMGFYDIRGRRFYTVVGQNHWQDPRLGFLDALGETLAVRAHVWRAGRGAALTITAVYPVDRQPMARVVLWPWHWHASVLAGCGLLALLYLLALGPWRARLGGAGRPFETGRSALFLASLAVVVVSLDGPIHDLSDQYLFWTHMVQHLLLAQVFPLLFLLGLPLWLRLALLRPHALDRGWSLLAAIPTGFILYSVVFSIWHVPALYDLMMRDHDFHVVMHLMVMATAMLMWWPVLGGEAVRRPVSAAGQMLYLFLLGIPMMAVAAPIVFAGTPLYAWYALAPRVGALSPLDDQRLGGLIMWVPGGLFYWGVMSAVFFRWVAREQEAEPPLLVPRPS
jgi:putative membrane protein